MRISVVIPTLNEERRIGERLEELARMPELEEVLVVDGGSTDRTVERALRHGVRVIEGRRGRGPQLNAGAAAARGEVLLFQHADVSLPGDAPGWIRLAFQDPEVVAGAFRVRTIDEDGSRLAPLLPFANLRSRTRSLPYGDQALFVRRSVFEAVGGYPDQPLMEDIELARRLKRRGRIRTASPSPLTASLPVSPIWEMTTSKCFASAAAS